MNRIMRRYVFLLLLAILLVPSRSWALAGDWQRDAEAAVRLISGVDGVGQEKNIPLGLEIEMAPEWHTYWRSPGMAGLPPQIDWQSNASDGNGSQNFRSARLYYPAPKRYTAYGLETIGYRGHVILPITVDLEKPGQALDIDASLSILVCSSTCLPKTFEVKLKVPEGAATESAESKLIQEFRNQLPTDADTAGIVVKNIVNNGDSLRINVASRDEMKVPDIFVENDDNISFTAPTIDLSADHRSASFTIKPADLLPQGKELAGMNLTLTLVNEAHALEQKVLVPTKTLPVLSSPQQVPLYLALIFAVIGGLILNFMPCVLPVLSLKIFSAIGHGGGEMVMVQRSFLMTAAGIFFSFLLLAGVTISLRSLGVALGWGVQFQQPLFLMTLVFLLTLFAANLWGLYEIGLPRWLADGLGNATYHPKLAGDFATGAFATLLATPCSAPFLGTAVGFALASGPFQILLIFAALGLGMIIPYLLVAFFPRLATALPKPGAWMNYARFMLGAALALTALWLIWVMAAQITAFYAVFVGLCMTGAVLVMTLNKTKVRKLYIKLGVLVFALAATGFTFAGPMIPKAAPEVDRLWLPFDLNALAADRQEGKTVFVDVTADWCLTCKANQKFVLSQDDLKERLFHSDVVAMQANWTNPDPVIAGFLHKYGRYGIPFNIVFGPGAEQGIALPEILTHDVVMEALDRASKTAGN